jgi:aminobenzoyl-glutamate utilization protein B
MKTHIKLVSACILIVGYTAVNGQENNSLNSTKIHTINYIESIEDDLIKLSDSIWNIPELGLEEHLSSEIIIDYLENSGFNIERGVAEMPTAFIGTYGIGKPIIGITGEYDALPGLSQKISSIKEAVKEGAPGHGCGHNLIGISSLGSVLAIKDLMDRGFIAGTIRYFGTPAEESGIGKSYMAREGYFDDLDVCVNWHPSTFIKSYVKNSESILDYHFRFKGKTSHAAGDPWNGKSALDGVEAFLHGINLLREHVKPSVRIHYIITNGGTAPNIVPDFAEVWLWARDNNMATLLTLGERIEKIAKGAAEIADVVYEIKFNKGVYNIVSTVKGAEVLQLNLEILEPIEYSNYEIEFAHQIQKAAGIEESGIIGTPLKLEEALNDTRTFTSDIGNVSWIVPTITLITTTAPKDVPWHSWCVVASSGMSIGHKGMIYSAKAMALTMIDLYLTPSLIEDLDGEFKEIIGTFQYKTMLPSGPPPIPTSSENQNN